MSDYLLYYGPAVPDLLQRYDLAILAPEGWAPADRAPAQAHGTRLLAYLSVLEVPATGAPPENVLRIGGRPWRNARWATWVCDPRHPATQRDVLERAAALRSDGWDGLFLDTLTDAESPDLPPGLQAQTVPAAARLVRALATAWPSGLRVQNWGFGPLLPLVAPWIHGLCWEDFPYVALAAGTASPYLDLARRLQRWAAKSRLALLGLNAAPADPLLAASVARTWGFAWYGAPGQYTVPPSRPGSRT